MRTGFVIPWLAHAAASLGQVVLDLVCLHPCLTPRVPIIAFPAFGRESVPHLDEGSVASAALLHEQMSLAIMVSLEMVNVMAHFG